MKGFSNSRGGLSGDLEVGKLAGQLGSYVRPANFSEHPETRRHISELTNSPASRASTREQHIKLMLHVNPFSESISTRNEAGLMEVIKQYREQDPYSKKRGVGFSNLQQVIESALDRLEQNNIIVRESNQGEQLKQVRRILIRDAYFL